MRRNYGWSERGEKAVVTLRRLNTRNISIMAAITRNEMFHYKRLEGNGNIDTFESFLNELIDRIPPDDIPNCILIMDNVAFHKNADIQALIRNRGVSHKYLPPYSPFLNPIENLFNQWKDLVKEAQLRSEQDLFQAIDEINQALQPAHLENYFRHAETNCLRCTTYDIIDHE